MEKWKPALGNLVTPNLLVVGGTGFIGHYLVQKSRQLGWNVDSLSLHRPKFEQTVQGANYLVGDIAKKDTLSQVHQGDKYDYVVNLGGYIDHCSYFDHGADVIDQHFRGVQNLIELVQHDGLRRFVQIGTSDEYGDNPAPQNENDSEKPLSPYAVGKLASKQLLEMLYRSNGFPCTILRFFLVYGPGQHADRFLPQLIKGCLNGESFPVSAGEQYRDFCYVTDIVEAIICSINEPNALGQLINVASGKRHQIKDVIKQVQSLIGKGCPQFGDVSYRHGENMELYADIQKAQRLLQWSPSVDFETGLSRTINWFRKQWSD